ncbi:MAG: ABC transporter substrate-binding protein [Anderseniella sp.]|uniref:taurine ABC transporter substrate-binding protein n=1 Tax=Parasphingorhabdus sp. TaxID=2709688 RepID=UPI00328D05C3
MKKFLTTLLASAALAVSAQVAQAAGELKEISVAYFLEWPMPMMESKANGDYDKALGMKVNWVSFETGTAMSAAMASGDIQIAVSQGIPPFVVAASGGQDLQVIDVAVSYSDNDNCVVRTDLEIDKSNAKDLEGKTVAIPLGTAAHYGFLRQMDHFGVDTATLKIVDMPPTDAAPALAQKNLDFACGYGGGLARMKESGNVLLTGAEKEELGILVFDVTSAPAAFISEHPDVVAKFLSVTAKANEKWNSGKGGDAMLEVIAKEAGMDLAAAKTAIATMKFPSVEEQLSEKWLGGGVQTFMGGVAGVFKEAGNINATLDSYETNANKAPLMAASKM